MLAIASTADRGTRWVTNSFNVKDAVLRLVEAPASGSGRPMLLPGWRMLARTMPSSRETSEAVINQPIALQPTRPTVLASPMWAMPTTRVVKTSGAMIILISRRNTSVTMEM